MAGQAQHEALVEFFFGSCTPALTADPTHPPLLADPTCCDRHQLAVDLSGLQPHP